MPFCDRIQQMRSDARQILMAGIAAVNASRSIFRHCHIEKDRLIIGRTGFDLDRYRHIYVIGAGKATAQMAAAIEQILSHRITAGTISVKYGHTAELHTIGMIEAGHPVPDLNGITGATAILELARHADADDLVICLISGGGSALMPLPAPPVTLSEKQETIRILLSCGADIHEINAIRKHISMIKGGLLARAAFPATVITLMISDVVGDRPDVIASGPTTGDLSRFTDCLGVIRKYGLESRLPRAVVDRIRTGAIGRLPETPKPGDVVFDKSFIRIVASNTGALQAARSAAESMGYHTAIWSATIEGDTTEAARMHAAIATEILKTGIPTPVPACILSGGETTVKIAGHGKGGRNQEFALAAAMGIAEQGNIVVLSAGTDGTDGPTDAAGAVVDSTTVRRAANAGLDPEKYLADNDSYHFFEQTGDLLKTGPTGTNVMDLRIIMVD